MSRNNTISKLERIHQKFNQAFNYRHWYSIKISYRSKSGGHEVFNFSTNVGVISKKEILRSRNIKNMFPLHTKKQMPSHLLNNGTLEYDVICYIGYIHSGYNA